MKSLRVKAGMTNHNTTHIGGPTGRGLLLNLAMLIAATALPQGCIEAGPPSVKLDLQPERLVVRPGEPVLVTYKITNTSNGRVLVAANPDGVGGLFAAKTVRIGLAHVASGESLPRRSVGACGTGEGFQERHFHSLRPGKSMEGHFSVEWGRRGRVPVDVARGTWRVSAQYVRTEGMDPGLWGLRNGKQLWEKTDVVSSQVATADIEVADWDDEATRALGEQILEGSIEAARITLHGRVQAVWPQLEQVLLGTERPSGYSAEFRQAAARAVAVAPLPEGSRILIETAIRIRDQYDRSYLLNCVTAALASYPPETVGPWAVDLFNNSEDQYVRDLALKVLERRRYQTDDPGVIGHVHRIVTEEIHSVRMGSEARHWVDLCRALGVKNTRPTLERIYDRIKGTSDPRWLGLKEDIEELLAQEDEP